MICYYAPRYVNKIQPTRIEWRDTKYNNKLTKDQVKCWNADVYDNMEFKGMRYYLRDNKIIELCKWYNQENV